MLQAHKKYMFMNVFVCVQQVSVAVGSQSVLKQAAAALQGNAWWLVSVEYAAIYLYIIMKPIHL